MTQSLMGEEQGEGDEFAKSEPIHLTDTQTLRLGTNQKRNFQAVSVIPRDLAITAEELNKANAIGSSGSSISTTYLIRWRWRRRNVSCP